MEDLNDKVAVVTGAASGIGRALAVQLSEERMKVVLSDVDETRLRALEHDLTNRGADVLGLVCDVSDAASVEDLAQRTLERFGAVHVACNNAGVIGRGDPWTGPLADWHRVLGINLYGVIHGIRTFLPIMAAQGVGHIVNTASMAGLTAVPGAVPYSVSKHGVVAASEALYLELQATGSPIGVSCLCPGFVKTDLMHNTRHEVLDNEQTPASSPIGSAIMDELRRGVDAGIPAAAVASEVVGAVRANRFWVLTHPESRGAPVQRMRAAARGENPAYGPPSRHPELARLKRRALARLRR